MSSVADKHLRLEELLQQMEKVVVGYSGGVDSSVLAGVAHAVLGHRALAVTAMSPALAERERRHAAEVAASFGWNHRFVETRELHREEYARNSPDRCYWCKTELFDVLAPLARREGAEMAVGTNADDLGDYRPGIDAARENSVRTPLVEAGLGKAEVRALARDLGLPTADKPASPCLASRFAYGVRVTEEGLRRVDRAEEAMRQLGFDVFRVRDHGDLARVEVPAERIEEAARRREEITARLRALGFRYVTLDLVGFRSGSLNEVLPTPKLR